MPASPLQTLPWQELVAQGWTLSLVLARVLPLGLALGVLTRGWVPIAVALSLGMALAYALVPLAGVAPPVSGLAELALRTLRELSIGATFALSLSFALLASSWAVRLSHPRDARFAELAAEPLSRAYVLCALWLVLSLGGLRAIVLGLAESFRDAPLAGGPLDARALGLGTAQLLADALVTALGFALPLLVSVWLLELTAALLERVGWSGQLGGHRGAPLSRPLLTWFAVALLLVPIASHAPESVRLAITAARALTRALAR